MSTMQLHDWGAAISSTYLEDFIPAGGAAVKFAIAMGETSPTDVIVEITRRGNDRGFLTATIDASRVKIGSVEHLVGAIVDQLDIGAIVDRLIEELAIEAAYSAPMPGPGSLAERIAEANDIDAQMVISNLRPLLASRVFRNHTIAKDMRIAIVTLADRRLTGGEGAETATTTISDWLGGRVRKVATLRQLSIHSKVNRSNARYLFESLLQVIRLAGFPGLLVSVDISRFIETERDTERVNYSKASLLDAYEVLREFVDATDDLESFLMVVTAPTAFLDTATHSRGLGRYQALKSRVYDEVRDRHLPNPLAALVRVGSNVPEVLR